MGMTTLLLLLLVVDSLLCNVLLTPLLLDKLEDEDGLEKDALLGCCTVAVVLSSLTSILGKDEVLVLGLRNEDNASGELAVRLRSKVFLLGAGTGFLVTLLSADLSSGKDSEVETGEVFS